MDKVKINYDHTYSSKYTRDYYRGKSFHYAGLWKPGAHYVCDAYNVDFIVHDSMMLVCKKNHTATAENEPLDLYELPDGLVGLRSDYWDVVMPALYGNSRYVVLALEQEKGTSQVHAMSQNAVTIELDALDEAIINNVERIDSDIAQKWSEINQTADQISATVAENRRISESADRQLQANITINAEAIATEVSDRTTSEGQIVADYNSKFTQTAREIATEVSAREAAIEGVTADYNSKISQTATQIRSEVNEHVETLEGEINDTNSALTQTAGEIRAEVASTKTDLEGQISTAKAEIKVTTDAITSTVEANKATADGQYSTLNSKIDQTADSITSTVEAYKEELDGTIADNYSVLDQKADSISATVAANKIDADGKIETVQSNLTQTATDIRAEVTANKQETDAAISDLSSSLTLTASEIRGEVAAHVETLEGEISDTNSTLSQTAEAIRSEVNSHVETLEGEIEETNSTLTQTASDIRSEVSTSITNTTNSITEAYTSAIEQTADEITTSVQQVTDSLDGRLTTAESNITQNANAITLETEARQDADTRIGNTLTAHQGLIESLQQQVDGAIDMHFYPGVPTLNNLPASEWTTDHEKDTHLGDLYYDKNTGFAYRFVKDNDVYRWAQIDDDAIAKALADAARAQATADGKMTIFYGQPSTYRVGDLWIMEVAHTGDTGDKKDCIIKKSTQDRDNNYVESDWVLVTDVANASKVKAAFAILADMINSEVGSYTSDNELVPGSIYSYIKQYKDRISLKVDTAQSNAETNAANDIKSKLLATGIDIADKKIEMTADNIVLKNNSGTRALTITNGSDGKPVIDTSSLNVSGIFTTSAWNTTKSGILDTAQGYANTAQSNAEATASADASAKANAAQSAAEATAAADATNKANAAKNSAIETASADATNKANAAETNAKNYANSADYLTNYVVPKVSEGTTALKNQLEGNGGSIKAAQDAAAAAQGTANTAVTKANTAQGTADGAVASINEMAYLKNAILDNGTAIAGGLILSTLIQLGSNPGQSGWQVYSGINGSYQGGSSIAFWTGGDMSETGSRPAKTVLRMDGSGYLASKNISWDSNGIASFNGNINVKSITFDDGVTIDGSKITGTLPNQTAYAKQVTVNGSVYSVSNNNVTLPNYPTKVSQLSNDSGYLTSHQSLAGYATENWVNNKGYITGIDRDMIINALGYTPVSTDTNTHRPIQLNNAEILGNNTTALNLLSGSNISITNSGGNVTIASTIDLSTAMLKADYIVASGASIGKIKAETIDVDSLYVKHLQGATGDFSGAITATSGRIDGQLVIGSGGSIISTNNRDGSVWASDTVNINASGIGCRMSSSASATRSYACDINGAGISLMDLGSGGTSAIYVNASNIRWHYTSGTEHWYTVPWTEDIQYIQVVSQLPQGTSDSTLYFVTG